MSLLGQLREMIRDLDAADDAAFLLWTCLPSHEIARKYHKDYEHEVQPSNADIMKEASVYIAYLRGDLSGMPDNDCPCGELHLECKVE